MLLAASSDCFFFVSSFSSVETASWVWLDNISKLQVLFVSALEGEGLEDLSSPLRGRQMPRGRLGTHVVSC